MKVKTKIFLGSVLLLTMLIIGTGYSYYLYNKPHPDIQAAPADIDINSDELVDEFLKNTEDANKKYFPENASAKILIVSGKIASIDDNMNGQKVILLKEKDKEIGVSCTFSNQPNENVNFLKVGETIAIKGLIKSGGGYDEDLDLYEDVLLEKCDLYMNKD